jgi:peptidoglycan-associated lipoprotein
LVAHTDERGTDEYNLSLGERSARSLAGVLQGHGVPPDSLRILSVGESQPADTSGNEQSLARNRRVEIRLE